MEFMQACAQIKKRLEQLDFHSFWPGFAPCPFAIYDSEFAVLDGKQMPRPEGFYANTALEHEGRWIAIWKLEEGTDLDILASKLVHEMFHAFQYTRGESRFPKEMEALFTYGMEPEYFAMKYEEDLTLAGLCEAYLPEGYRHFLKIRAGRKAAYPLQYAYDSAIECIEGTAQYVELMALKALAPEKYARACGRLLTRLKDPKGMVPVRPLCYDAGAALLLLCKEQGLPVCMEVGVVDTYLVEVPPVTQKTALPAHEQVRREIQERREAFSRLIQTAAMRAPLAQGDFKLLGVNVYSAMYMEGYVYTEYFLMYEGETGAVTLEGNFLLEMAGRRIRTIWRLD